MYQASTIESVALTRCALTHAQLGALVPVITLAAGAVALPGDVSVGPRSNTLFVVDLATQQVRRFAGASGAALPPIGAAGGYTDGDPAVSAARFWFAGGGPFVAATDSPDETTFVNDPGNRRVLALARGGTGGELPNATVSYLARCYKSAVHPVNASRVFANFIEYAVDAHASLASPGAWTLVRNWGAGLNASFQPNADAWGGSWLKSMDTVLPGNQTLPPLTTMPTSPLERSVTLWSLRVTMTREPAEDSSLNLRRLRMISLSFRTPSLPPW
jgi:hypothetical protein